jgi:hypothetical protein
MTVTANAQIIPAIGRTLRKDIGDWPRPLGERAKMIARRGQMSPLRNAARRRMANVAKLPELPPPFIFGSFDQR